MSQLNDIKDFNKRIDKFIDNSIVKLDDDVKLLQSKLLNLILSELVNKFDKEGGALLPTNKNFALVAEIDTVFLKFEKLFQRDRLRKFAGDLLNMSRFSIEYYKLIGFGDKTVDKIGGKINVIENYIGIKNNKIVKGSFLDTLTQSHSIRLKLKNYVIKSISAKKGYRFFLRGFKDLIEGANRKGGGIIERYWRTYVYDKFNETHEVQNTFFAEQLGLKHFIYEGSLIKTSRKFCVKRAGKAYTIEETKNWKDDKDLIDPKTRESYVPLIERGRYNCRHFINYISEDLYKQIKGGAI